MQALDTGHKRRAGAVFAIFALLASLMVGFASPANAESFVTIEGTGAGGTVRGSINGGSNENLAARVFRVNTGSGIAYMYCIDINTPGVTGTYKESTWGAAQVPNEAKVLRILQQNPASASTTDTQAKATQAAIWHFTDNFVLDMGSSTNSQAVKDLYAAIVADANANPVVTPVAPTLAFTPTDQSAEANTGLVYEVETTSPDPVVLSLTDNSGSAQIHPAPGGVCDTDAAPITQASDGDFVCLYSEVPGGGATLNGTVSQANAVGRVYIPWNTQSNGPRGGQKLVFASGSTVTANAKANGSWTSNSTFDITVTCESVTITSNDKDLSNVIWQSVNSQTSQKADGLSGKTYVIPNDPANPVNAVWIKAGNNKLQPGDPSPLPPNGGNQGVGAYFAVAAPQGCVPDPGARAAVECVDFDGTITVTLNNTGYGDVTFDVTNPVTSQVTTKVVGPKGTDTVVFTDVPDGTYDVPVTAKVAGQPDEDLTIEGLTVSCDAPGTPEVLQKVECVDFDGTVTLTLKNTGTPGKAEAIQYVVKDLGGNVVFEGPVAPGAQQVVTIDDVPDGVPTFPVTADGIDKSQTVTVDCDAPGTAEVTEKVECVDFDGTVTLTLKNTGTPGKAKPVHYVVEDLSGTVVYDDHVAAGDTVPVVIDDVPDGEWTFPVTADGENKDQTVTVDCDGPGTPVVEKLVECVDFDGTVTLTLKNTGTPGKAEPVAFVVKNTDGSPKWQGEVAAGQQQVVTFTGVADGTHTYPVSADGQDVDQTVTVDCDAPGTPSVAGDVECVDFDGTITVTLANTGAPGKAKPVSFVVKDPVTDAVVFDGTVDAGDTEIIEFDGLADGDYTVPVTADGVDESLQLTVDCDGPGIPEVDSVVECTADGGEVTIVLGNEGIDGKNLPITYRVTDPRDGTSQDVTVEPGQTLEVVYEDVADGEYTFPVDVIEGDEVVESLDQTVTVRCAEPEVLGISVECAEGGVVVVLGNPGTNPTEMTVRKGDTVIATEVVAPGDEVRVLVPMEEGETATITVTDGDQVLSSQTITLDCEDPAPPTTPTTAQVAGVTQTPTAVSPTGALPYTGGDVVRTLGLGLLLAAAGFGLVLATRRRRS